MQISLYYFPVACSLVPYVALTEANADFNVKTVNFYKGEHLGPDYMALNPKHKVPLLVVDGEALTENVAILQWVARNFPEANLLPAGLDEFKAISLMAWCASGIHPSLTPHVMPQKYCDLPDTAENVKQCAQKVLHEVFGIANGLLEGRQWFFDHFTIPDAYFFWCFRRAQQFEMDISAYGNCKSHFDRMSERPSVKKVVALEQEILAAASAR